jgi:hypothetical protein
MKNSHRADAKMGRTLIRIAVFQASGRVMCRKRMSTQEVKQTFLGNGRNRRECCLFYLAIHYGNGWSMLYIVARKDVPQEKLEIMGDILQELKYEEVES